MNGALAAVVAKVDAAETLNPRAFGAVLVVGALLLITSGIRDTAPREARRA